ncbi:MAG: hypothetical protein RBR86_05060 [Pseudobdellovibrionaceae bacterium]|jgi:hypothetical protein|nr:hypothetical protein [Pseudobdellovibrionaceae bacterium]
MADPLGPIQPGECKYMDDLVKAQEAENTVILQGSNSEQQMAVFKANFEEIVTAAKMVSENGCPSPDSKVAQDMAGRNAAMNAEVNQLYTQNSAIKFEP